MHYDPWYVARAVFTAGRFLILLTGLSPTDPNLSPDVSPTSAAVLPIPSDRMGA